MLAFATAAALLTPQTPAAAAPSPPPSAADAVLLAATPIQQQVEQICGAKFTGPVAMRAMTRAQMQQYAEERVDRELGDGRLERMDGWLHALALLRSEQSFRTEAVKLLVGQTAAVYDSDAKVLRLLDDTAATGPWYARYTIAHELAHALDDQTVGIDRLTLPAGHQPTKDQMFATGAVIEGSAIAVSDAWAALEPPTAADQQLTPAAQQDAARSNAALLSAPAYCTLMIGRHLTGRLFFAAGHALKKIPDEDYLGLLTIRDALPASTEQILHPRKFWLEQERDPPVTLADDDAVAAAIGQKLDGLRVLDRNTLGELVAALLAQPIERKLDLARVRRPEAWTNAAATGWGGDRLFLVGSKGGTASAAVEGPGVVWITAWDTVPDREEFVAALQQHRGSTPGFAHAVLGRAAAFAFGSARTLDATALLALLAGCRFVRDGADWTP
jgi:hypothetical protein